MNTENELGGRFPGLREEAEQLKLEIDEVMSMLLEGPIDFEEVQSKCVGPNDGDKERIDYAFLTDVGDMPSESELEAVAVRLRELGWTVKRSENERVIGVYGDRDEAVIELRVRRLSDRLGLTANTACYEP